MKNLEFKQFDGKPENYRIWRIRVKDLLTERKLFSAVNRAVPVEDDAKRQFQDDTEIAKTIIRKYLDDNIVDKVGDEATIPEIFNAFDEEYSGAKIAPSTIWASITTTKFSGGDIHEHVEKFEKFLRELETSGDQLSENSKKEILLQSLSEGFEDLKTILMTQKETSHK